MKKTRAPIVYEGGIGFAIFATEEKEGRFLLVLDFGNPQSVGRKCWHLDQTKLTPAEPGKHYDLEYWGDAISIDGYDKLDEARRGFVYST